MKRGEYMRMSTGRGTFADRRRIAIGAELSNEEIRRAMEAGNRNAAPLIEDHARMMAAWPVEKPLSREQYTQILQAALNVALGAEHHLTATIATVPSHWEATLSREGGLQQLRAAIADAPAFEAMIQRITAPTVVPGFRTWIDHLFGRSESAVVAIGAVSDILPNWMFMRNLLAELHHAAIWAIRAIIALGRGAEQLAKDLPDIAKWIGFGILGLGGIYLVSKLSGHAAT